MKKITLSIAAVLLISSAFLFASCSSHYSPTSTNNPTPTPTPGGHQSYVVSIASGSLGSYSGYYYSSSTGTNNTTTGLYSLTAHVGDTVSLPAAGIHPLYFIDTTGTCVDNGVTSSPSAYTFTATGMYYFHCGIHATGCSPNITTCNATGCASLAGAINVQ